MLSKPAYIMGYEPCGETKSEAIMKFSINLSKWKKKCYEGGRGSKNQHHALGSRQLNRQTQNEKAPKILPAC